jgi:DNA mismatch endonuclease (patch repair protein)
MSRIRGKDTAPEMRVRRAAHALGYRFRLHRKDLAGTPDMVFPKFQTALFIHGCFWHCHGYRNSSLPKSRPEYWRARFSKNMARDTRNVTELERLGWKVAVIWECETRDDTSLKMHLREILRRSDAGEAPVRGPNPRESVSEL